jgi:hypothetical protein
MLVPILAPNPPFSKRNLSEASFVPKERRHPSLDDSEREKAPGGGDA